MTRFAVLLLLSAVATPAAAAPLAAPTPQAPSTPQARPAPWAAPRMLGLETVRAQFADSELAIDRPAGWQESRIRGGGVQLHLIGGAGGFPHFTVQSDAGAGLPVTISAATERQLVEELFSTLVHSVSGTTVLSARWAAINGLRVHDSMSIRPSAAGPIKVRRLLFLHAGVPYVMSWGAPAEAYEAIAEHVEHCVLSLAYSD